MITYSSQRLQKEFKRIGYFLLFSFAFFGLLAYWQNGGLSTSYYVSLPLVTYFFFATKATTQIYKDKIIKRRGWLFPSFKSQYNQFRSIKLQTRYIYQEGSGVKSYYAFYVGIVNGPFLSFVDLTSGIKDSDDGQAYIEFTEQLIELTQLPLTITDEFETQFKNSFGFEFNLKSKT